MGFREKKKLLFGFLFVLGIMLMACSPDAGEDLSDDVVHLNMTAWGNPEELTVYQRAINAFEEEHTNIRVTLTPTPGETYEQRLLTQLQGGRAPDIFYAGDLTISKLIETGTIRQLNDFLESPDSFVKADEFADGLWGASRIGDDIYGLPVDCNPLVFYYNRGLFDELNIQSPQEYFDEGNWNWDAFVEVTNQLQANGHHGFIMDSGWSHIFSWVWSNGGELYDDQGNVVMDQDPNTIEAIEFINEMLENGNMLYGGALTEGQGDDAMFMSETVGMVAAGRWYVPMFNEVDGLDYDIVPWPTNTGNQLEPAAVATAYLVMNENTEHPEEALTFLTYYVSQVGQEARLADTGNAVPSIEGLDHVVTEDDIPEHAQHLIDARDVGFASDIQASVPGLDTELEDIYELMMVGHADTETTISEAAEIARFMIEQYQ